MRSKVGWVWVEYVWVDVMWEGRGRFGKVRVWDVRDGKDMCNVRKVVWDGELVEVVVCGVRDVGEWEGKKVRV